MGKNSLARSGPKDHWGFVLFGPKKLHPTRSAEPGDEWPKGRVVGRMRARLRG